MILIFNIFSVVLIVVLLVFGMCKNIGSLCFLVFFCNVVVARVARSFKFSAFYFVFYVLFSVVWCFILWCVLLMYVKSLVLMSVFVSV